MNDLEPLDSLTHRQELRNTCRYGTFIVVLRCLTGEAYLIARLDFQTSSYLKGKAHPIVRLRSEHLVMLLQFGIPLYYLTYFPASRSNQSYIRPRDIDVSTLHVRTEAEAGVSVGRDINHS